MISTKLNRSHLATGKRALILPCLSRSNEDIKKGIKQFVSIEDAMGKISFSEGCFPATSNTMKSEVSIVVGMAKATLNKKPDIEWDRFENDYQYIRSTIAQTIPVINNIEKCAKTRQSFYLENPLRQRIFKTPSGKAMFSNHPLETVTPDKGELMLMTIRSHDQFNTSIFGLDDRYRGISNERRVLFMNSEDMADRNILPKQMVDICSNYDNKLKKLEGYYAVSYPIRKGCVATYFPEANVLTSINNTNKICETPAYKSVRVKVLPLS